MKEQTPSMRQPIPPDRVSVEALVSVMSDAAEQYCSRTRCSSSDVLTAIFTMAGRCINYHLYHSDPPMSVREQFNMRKTIIKGLERLWHMAAGGGPSSRFRAN